MGRLHDYAWCWADPHQQGNINVFYLKSLKDNGDIIFENYMISSSAL